MAAAGSNAEAMRSYAFCLREGRGVSVDEPAALRYFQVAADAGDAEGQFEVAMAADRDKDVSKAERYLKLASDQGYAKACYCYGLRLEGEAAAGQFRVAAEQGLAVAEFKYGHCLRRGNGVPADVVAAARMIKQAVGHGLVDAQVDYGVFLAESAGELEADDLQFVKEAAVQGDRTSMYRFALCLRNGTGLPVDETMAMKFFKLAADRNHADARFHYAAGLPRGDPVATTCYALAASQGHPGAMLQLATCLQEGVGVQANKAAAAQFLRQAAESGLAEAQYRFAICLNAGDGVPRDVSAAAAHFKLAADQGHAPGQGAYGLCLREGRGVPRNEAEAARYFALAVRQECSV